MEKRSFSIDLLRGISMLYIVGYWHLFDYTQAFPLYNNVITARLTIVAVSLFVLISGYLIGAKNTCSNKNGILLFYINRLLRVYPPFLFSIFLFYILGISGETSLLKSATLISMFFQKAPLTLWFVSMIIIFYLIAPLLINIAINKKNYLLFCILLISSSVICNHFFHILNLRLIIFFPAFAGGVLLAVDNKLIKNMRLSFVTLLLFVSFMISFFDNRSILLNMPLSFFGSLLIFLITLRGERKIVHYRFVAHLSYASFFMYLLHRPVFVVLCYFYFPQSGALQIFYLLVICLPLIISISWISQKAYDKYLILYLTRMVEKKIGSFGLKKESAPTCY